MATPVLIDYDVAGAAALDPQISSFLATNPSGYGCAGSRGAWISWAAALGSSAEQFAWDAGFVARPSATQLAQSATTTDWSSIYPPFGAGAPAAAAVVLGSSWSGSASSSGDVTWDVPIATLYLAAQRVTRSMALTTRPVAAADAAGALRLPGELGAGETGELGLLPVAAYFVIAGVYAIAVAAYAWVKHDEAVETARGLVQIRIAELTLAAQTKAALDLARVAHASGQTVNIPDVVRALGVTEAREWRGGGVAALGVGALVLGGAAYGLWKGKQVFARV